MNGTNFDWFWFKIWTTLIVCDSTSAINLSEILFFILEQIILMWGNFLKDQVEYGYIKLDFVDTKNQFVGIFAKSLQEDQFCSI